MSGAGTKTDPWQLRTPPLSSDYEMYLDELDGTAVIVCVVGKTTLLYDALAIDDLHAMLIDRGEIPTNNRFVVFSGHSEPP